MELDNTKHVDNRVDLAYNEFMTRLFGSVPTVPQDEQVDRDKYTEEMVAVQERYGLHQGDPDFLEWMLTLVGRSPVLTSEGKIVYDTGTDAAGEAMGETSPSQTERH